MLSAFPMLLPESLPSGVEGGAAHESWHGVIQAHGRSFRVRIVASSQEQAKWAPPRATAAGAALPAVLALEPERIHPPSAAAAASSASRHLLLQGEPALQQLLSGYQSMLRQRWQQSADLRSFLVELQEIMV
jgi:hypothetical protein